MTQLTSLTRMGWQTYFQQQLSLEECTIGTPARVVEQHKTEISVATESGAFTLRLLPSMPEMVVGDWLLLDDEKQIIRLLDRKTCFSRKAAGSHQLIYANVDTAFIVCSMNEDFNLNRIERFLSLVNEAGVEPVIVLSKCDQADIPDSFIRQVRALDPDLMVEGINSLDINSTKQLSPWIKEGRTIAVVGSSGVGKSTLVNTLLGEQRQSTGGTRDSDKKGRHTTTTRSLVSLDSGGLILDTPGMREIQLADCKEAISATFSDIETLARQCKFSDCMHDSEPGCEVQQALAQGDMDQRRLNNYLKLMREESHNTSSLSEKRASDKALGKFYKSTLVEAKKLKGR